MKRILGAALLALLCGLAGPAAATLSIRVDPPDYDKRAAGDTRWDVYLEGEIEAGAFERMRRELAQIGADGADVHFDSTGGSLVDAIGIGRLLRKLGASTRVDARASGPAPEPGKCFSACAIAFLGGVYRTVPDGSLYGVHRVSKLVQSPQDFDVGQMVAAQVAGYIREMGVDGRLFDRMASVGNDRIYLLGPVELRALHVVNDGRQPAEWWSEVSADGPSVTGSRRTADGSDKLSLACYDGGVVLKLAYRPGGDLASAAASSATQLLLIDGAAVPLPTSIRIDAADGRLDASFALPAELARRLVGAAQLGHAVPAPGSAPAAVGLSLDVDPAAGRRIKALIESCLAPG